MAYYIYNVTGKKILQVENLKNKKQNKGYQLNKVKTIRIIIAIWKLCAKIKFISHKCRVIIVQFLTAKYD